MNERPVLREYPARGKELLFGLLLVLGAMALCNFTVYGGLNLGFGLGAAVCVLLSCGYLLSQGRRLGGYTGAILALCLVIALSFGRGDDGFVKFVMLCFLAGGTNLALCLMAGKQQMDPGSPATLYDSVFTFFGLGVGELPQSLRGLTGALSRSGPMGKKTGAVLAGLGISVPLLAVMIPLLMGSDAAFEGLVDLLPEFSLSELVITVLLGGCLGFVLYTRAVALIHYEKPRYPKTAPMGLSKLTVNTVLSCVCLLYCVYLASQLAYFVGGFSGILPKDYTLAQYARRGFFEMAWLCAINLGVIALSLYWTPKKNPAPLSTRLLCLCIALVTAFFVAAASAKMFLYIGAFGLTRLRVLTQVVLLFLALTTGLVAVRLFVPRLPYMKTVILAGLLLGALVSWVDVDSLVSRYNVDAYLSGRLDTVDVAHLGSLGQGAVPQLHRLTQEAPDPAVAKQAENILQNTWYAQAGDFRSWNYVNHKAAPFLPDEPEWTEDAQWEE